MTATPSTPGSRRLRVAVAVPEWTGWEAAVVAALEASEAVESVAVVVGGRRRRRRRGPVAWLATWMRPVGAGEVPPSPERVDLAAHPTDVVLELGGGSTAVQGRVWRFRFGDGAADLAEALAIGAIARRSVVEVALVEGEQTLRAGVFRFDGYDLRSAARAAAASIAAWPAECAAAATDPLAEPPYGALPGPVESARPPKGPLAVWRLAGLAVRVGAQLVRRTLWSEVWTIGLTRQPVAAIVEGADLGDVTWLPERGARGIAALVRPRAFAADPFLCPTPDGLAVLFEALDYRTNRGWIAAADAPPRRGARGLRDVFRNEWHWSYPYVFTEGSEVYCIPETADAGGVLLHRLTPDGFEQEADLLPGVELLDPSIVRDAGRYWLFGTRRDGPMLNTELHLFVADHLRGPYRPHHRNPVKVDARSARPGGTIFRVGDHWYRPGQDCGDDYGVALAVHRIDVLDEHNYRETEVARLRPRAPYPAGLHTLSTAEGWVAVDAKRYAFSPPMLLTRARQVVARRHGKG